MEGHNDEPMFDTSNLPDIQTLVDLYKDGKAKLVQLTSTVSHMPTLEQLECHLYVQRSLVRYPGLTSLLAPRFRCIYH